MPKNLDTSTDSNDEEKPLPKKPEPIEKDPLQEAEEEVKKAEVAELNKKGEKKAKL